MNSLRRFEILIPLQFNDGTDVSDDLISDALLEIVGEFGALSYYHNSVQGRWTDEDTIYIDRNSKIVIDIPNTPENIQWMRDYKARWKEKLNQLDLWLISYEIDVF